MMKVLCTDVMESDSGATSIEYSLIAAVMSVALYSGAGTLGDAVTGHFKKLSQKIDTASSEHASTGTAAMMVSVRADRSGEAFTIRGPLP